MALLCLFVVLAALYVAPPWMVAYLPTLDGPSHVYNAWVLRQYGNHADYPLFARFYQVDWRPLPNWLGHALLALLMVVAPPVVAEKLLVSGYVLLLLFACWYLAGAVDPARRFYAFLGFPFVFNAALALGFYNFCLSVALFLIALGYWWRHRERPAPRPALVLSCLLLACYFAHIVSLLLAVAAIGVLWAATLRADNWRRHLRHLAVLAPQLALPLWFVWVQHGQPMLPAGGAESAWPYLLRASAISLDAAPRDALGLPLALIFAALLAARVGVEGLRWNPAGRWRLAVRPEDAFLLLSLLFAVLLLVFPDGMAGGSYLKPRLGLYPFLVLLPWFSARIGPAARRAVVGALAIVALANLLLVGRAWLRLDPLLRAYLRGLDAVPADSRLLPLTFAADGSRLRSPVLGHLTGYAAAEKGLIDWDNYEAMTTLFPLRFRPGVSGKLDLPLLASPPAGLDVAAIAGNVDFIYTWHLPEPSPVAARIRALYHPVFASGPVALFARTGR